VLDYNQYVGGIDLKDESAALLFDCEKMNEQMVYKTILQATEYLSSECHGEVQK
jgi:hypothetical protein